MAKKNTSNELKLSPRAKARLTEILEKDPQPNHYLRLFVVGGGCAGLQYGFAWDPQQHADDVLVQLTEPTISLVIDPISFMYFSEAEVDFVDSPSPRFTVKNSKIRTTCGCGGYRELSDS